jgi:iron(II)-dependent oxidoreductase
VVGVSWHEAAAYATWMGKRLPTALEWRKACGWPEQLSGTVCHRYPWGDVFDPSRANLWASGQAGTVPVHAYPAGNTANGVHQMTGNVWEWLSEPLAAVPCRPSERLETWRPMRLILGGAFDTYLPGEAACDFVTAQGELDRRANVGVRCAVSLARLRAHHPEGIGG